MLLQIGNAEMKVSVANLYNAEVTILYSCGVQALLMKQYGFAYSCFQVSTLSMTNFIGMKLKSCLSILPSSFCCTVFASQAIQYDMPADDGIRNFGSSCTSFDLQQLSADAARRRN